MKKKIYKENNRFLSYQAKQALIYSFQEAKKNKVDIVSKKYLCYGLLKANPSLLTKTIEKIYNKKTPITNKVKIFIHRLDLYFKNQEKENRLKTEVNNILLSKSLRNSLYFLLRSSKVTKNSKINDKNYFIISTLEIFIYLLKDNSLRNWLKEEVFFIKKN